MKKLYMTLAAAMLAAPAMFAQDCLYLVGQPGGWMEPAPANEAAYANWVLPAVEEGSKVYDAKFNINAGDFMLRFYTELNGWDQGSIGVQVDDNPIEFTFTDGVYQGACVNGKGSWNNPSWEGGEVRFVVDLYTNQVTFLYGDAIDDDVPTTTPGTPGEGNPEYLYVRGTMNDWGADMAWAIYPSAADSNVYTGKFAVPAGNFTMKIADASWEVYNYGAEVKTIGYIYSDINYTGTWVDNGQDFTVGNWEGGELVVNFNISTLEIELIGADQPIYTGEEPEGPGPVEPSTPSGRLYIIGGFEGWDINSDAYPVYEMADGVYIAAYDVPAGDNAMFRFYTALGDWEMNSLGVQVEDNPIDCDFTDGVFTGSYVEGKGSWYFPTWTGGAITFKVDCNNQTVVFTEGITEEAAGVKAINNVNANLRYNNGIISASETTDFVVVNMAGQVVARAYGDSIDINTLGKGIYAVSANGSVIKIVK